MTRRQGRLAVIGVSLATVAACSAREFQRATSAQIPTHYVDSTVYIETARQPFSLYQLFYPKPLTVPTLYRAVGADGAAIRRLQQRCAWWSWFALWLALTASVRTNRARAAALLIFAFLLAPIRVGWSSVILSESINDSLQAGSWATAIALATAATRLRQGRRRSTMCCSLSAVLAVILTAWVFTRDTNAVTAIAAVIGAAAVWGRPLRADRWAAWLGFTTVAGSVLALWSSTVIPPAATGLSLHVGWPREVTARGTFALLNNLLGRVRPDPSGWTILIQHGLPRADDVARLTGGWARADPRFFVDPSYAPVRQWVVEHGAPAYAEWLLRHPIARADELVRHFRDVLAPTDLGQYMPAGWSPPDGRARQLVRHLTANEFLLAGLIACAPVLVRAPRRHPLTALAVVLIASGIVGAAVSYYGDLLEATRHCYGAGQQIVFGLFLALIASLDS